MEGKIDLEKLKRDMKWKAQQDDRSIAVCMQGGNVRFVPAAAAKDAGGYYNAVSRVTALYALRSHLRGRLHMTKREVIVGGLSSTGVKIYPVTMEDQERLVAQIWDQYLVKEEAA